MEHFTNRIADYCIKNGLVNACKREWLIYGLQKRFLSLFSAILLIAAGCLFASPGTAIAFVAFYIFLRKRASGYHAKTVLGCLAISLALEAFFLWLLRMYLPLPFHALLCGLSVTIVFTLAPYNHPNMHLSKPEIAALAKSAKLRISAAATGLILLYTLGLVDLLYGAMLGLEMTALLLCVAYIQNWKDDYHEKSK